MRTSATEFSCLCDFGDEGGNKSLDDERRTGKENKQIESRFCARRVDKRTSRVYESRGIS